MPQAKTKDFIVQLKSAKLLGFEITEAGNKVENQIDRDNYEFKWDISFKVDQKVKAITVTLITTLFDKISSPKIDLVRLKTEFTVEVKNFNDFMDKGTNKPVIPGTIIPILANIAVSTTRGIFLVCVSPTKFSNALIPLTDPKTFKRNPSS
jgi:hypothetical protein